MSAAGPSQFYRLAKYYDPITSTKDYRAEARELEKIARRFVRSGGREWLDVACGTGSHLAHLRRRHIVAGLDRSPEMLRIARRRLPGIPLRCADMRSFRLAQSFDVVSCLFSAIGHLESEHDLLVTFANIARHLKPGGIAIVEPWIDPADYRPGFVHLVTHRSLDLTVVRLAQSSRRRNHSIVRYHYLIAERGHRIRHFDVTDKGLLVPRRRLLGLARKAGLSARFLRPGLGSGRGLLIGFKPLRPGRTR
jgi:SAM-dependent methyltransferase